MLLMYLDEGRFLKVVLPGRKQRAYLGKGRFALGSKGRGKLVKLTIKRTPYKRFPNTLRVLLLNSSGSRTNHTKDSYFWICLQNFSWRIHHFLKMQRNLSKTITVCNVSKNAALPQVLFHHVLKAAPADFGSFSKFFQSISTSHSIPFNFLHALIVQIKAADVWPNSLR